MTHLLCELAELHDDALLSQLDALVRFDRRCCARIVAHIAEVDARRLYLDRGFGSMIDYARHALGFSESAAGRRVTAARLVRRFPVLLQRIEEGALHLTALTILGPHLTAENLERLVTAASGRSRLELDALVAPLREPVPVTPRTVVRVVRLAEAPTAAAGGGVGLFDTVGDTGSGEATPLPKAAPADRDETAPMPEPAWAERDAAGEPPRLAYRLSVTLSPETKALLDRAGELLRRDIRRNDVNALLRRALRLLVDATEARRYGKVWRPRGEKGMAAVSAEPPRAPVAAAETAAHTVAGSEERRTGAMGMTSDASLDAALPAAPPAAPPATPPAAAPKTTLTRTIPAAVRRAVAERDGGRCTFVAADGRRCGERGALEFHHRRPYAHGGATDADNLALLCPAHHRQVSERQFGKFLLRDAPPYGARYGNMRQARVTSRVGAGGLGEGAVRPPPTRARRV
jgi:hypothetical protein